MSIALFAVSGVLSEASVADERGSETNVISASSIFDAACTLRDDLMRNVDSKCELGGIMSASILAFHFATRQLTVVV